MDSHYSARVPSLTETFAQRSATLLALTGNSTLELFECLNLYSYRRDKGHNLLGEYP